MRRNMTGGGGKGRASRWIWAGLAAAAAGFIGARLVGVGPAVLTAIDAGMVALLMVVWWSAAALPLWVTSCIPLLAWPLLGLTEKGFAADVALAASPYADAYSVLYLGGMVLGVALESTGLHRRIALHVLRQVGATPQRLILGLLLATALVSAWISNTATTVMMLPIALALCREISSRGGGDSPRLHAALLLAVAYGSSVGGIATKIGSATNSIAAGAWEQRTGAPLPFFDYSLMAVPFTVLMLGVVWRILAGHARHDRSHAVAPREALANELAALGPLRGREARTALVFSVAVLLWMLGDVLRPEVQFLTGIKLASRHYEAIVSALAASAVLFSGCCRWKHLRDMPFSALLLLGGSFSMAAGLEAAGLTRFAATGLTHILDGSVWLDTAIVALTAVVLSAIASNTATITLLAGVLPARLPLHLTACFGSSCDFMLPAGTPPNAIVHSTGLVPMRAMLTCGWKLDLAAVLLLVVYGALVIAPWCG